MLISDFAGATGLSRDTVRFYVRLGLLRPRTSDKGGRHPYHFFTAEDVQTAEVIRVGQSLGLSLKEIAALDTERRESGITGERLIEILSGQLAGLEAKARESAPRLIGWLLAGRGRIQISDNVGAVFRSGDPRDRTTRFREIWTLRPTAIFARLAVFNFLGRFQLTRGYSALGPNRPITKSTKLASLAVSFRSGK
jgi:MerR family copper efflux transcriptional regulator